MSNYHVSYGYMDEDGNHYWNDAEAESVIHAADILHRLSPELFEVFTYDINGTKKDVTSQTLHIMVRYIRPAYRDGRKYGPYSEA